MSGVSDLMSTFRQYSKFDSLVLGSQKKIVFTLHNIVLLFIKGLGCVLCEVGDEILYII
jgi:hypothetical protein